MPHLMIRRCFCSAPQGSSTVSKLLLAVLLLTCLILVTPSAHGNEPISNTEPKAIGANSNHWAATVLADFGVDHGQNHGSLFEIRDANNNVVAGAGFLGAFSTECRSGRETLHVFLKSDHQEHQVDLIARPSKSSGTYLDDFQGRLFARARAERPSKGQDGLFRIWNAETNTWKEERQIRPLPTEVAGRILQAGAERTDQRANGTFHTHGEDLDFGSKTIVWGNHTILRLGPDEGYVRELYYANGYLFFRINVPTATPIVNKVYACRWTPGQKSKVDLPNVKSLPMSWSGEFIYAFGQLNNEVVIASNSGAVFAFKNDAWKTVRAANRKVSYQVYAMLTYNDKLLLGHYPTGQIYEYDGTELTHLKDWPPVPANVSPAAREAQTLTIYAGDLYVGVWPWGEVWRRDSNTGKWELTYRGFRFPEMSADYVHPYEKEASELGGVSNAWGQRITSMIPLNDSLFIATSSKQISDDAHTMPFLAEEERWQEFGQVHRYKVPGHMTAQVQWTPEPTEIFVQVSGNIVSVKQDGKTIATQEIPKTKAKPSPLKISWGRGVYGTFGGTMSDKRFGSKRAN